MKPIHKIDYQIHDLIRKRWSPRAFSEKEITQEELMSLFEASRWSPSAFNEQPWRFVYVLKKETEHFDKVLSLISEANQLWAKNAPMLIVAIAKKTLSSNGNPNKFHLYDVGQAVAYLTIQAMTMNLSVHQMGGFSVENTHLVLQIPEDYQAVTILAVGYEGDVNTLPDKFREIEHKAQIRKNTNEFVYQNNWKTK